MRRPAPSLAFLLLAAPALAQQPLQVKTEKANLVVETVARGLEHPGASPSCRTGACS